MSRQLCLALALALSTSARGDTSVGGGVPAPPARCGHEDGPFWKARREVGEAELGKLRPFDSLRHVSAHYLLFTHPLQPQDMRGARIVERRNHALVHTASKSAWAVVEDAAGALIGLLTVESGTLALLDADGDRVRWRVPLPERVRGGDSLGVLVDDERLVLASFHRIATGAALFALDLKTGASLWTAEVVQMGVGHSEYFNDVALERRGGVVVMRGYEAAGCYVQSFDAASGKRLSSTIPGDRIMGHKGWR